MQSSTPLLSDIIHTDSFDSSKNLWHQLASPSDPFDLNMNWSLLTLPDTVHDIDPNSTCIPGGLSQISLTPSPAQSDLRSPSPSFPPTISLNASTLPLSSSHSHPHSHSHSHSPPPSTCSSSRLSRAPHPYSISPANTTALFTRASSVSQPAGPNPPKKSRAPPSGPISTKDFIPPDVTGLTKREARLVKNRAAAFLSRQRKREEFEALESRVEQLEAENARLQAQLSKAGSVPPSPPPVPSAPSNDHLAQISRQQAQDLAQLKKSHSNELVQLQKAHANETVQLKRAHALDVANVNTQLMEALQREEHLQEELRTLRNTPVIKREDDVDSEDSDVDDDDPSAKKDSAKSAGSVAFMVLLFSLSALLTNKTSTQSSSTSNRPNAQGSRSRPTSFSLSSYNPLVDYSGAGIDYNSMGLDYGAFGALDSASPFNIETLLSSSPEDDVSMSALSSLAAGTSFSSAALMASAAESAISSLKACGPDAFEFDFKGADSKKIRVCVKGAGAGAALAAMKPSLPTPSTAPSSTLSFGTTFPSPIKFQPDDDLDMGWLAASSLTEAGQKRKRMVIEVNEPRPIVSKRKLSAEGSQVEEKWEINVSEEDYLDLPDTDHDVAMKL